MPKHVIESPSTATTIDRLALSSQHVRETQPSSVGNCCWSFCGCFEAEGSNYNLCGGCTQGMVGCFELES